MFAAGRHVADERADAVAAVGQHRNRLIYWQLLAPQYLAEPMLRCGILTADQAEITVVAILGHRLADDDLEVPLLVMPVPEIAAVDPDDDRFPWDRRHLISGRTAHRLKLAGSPPRSASCRAATLCRCWRMVSGLVPATGRTSLSKAAVMPRRSASPSGSPDKAAPARCAR